MLELGCSPPGAWSRLWPKGFGRSASPTWTVSTSRRRSLAGRTRDSRAARCARASSTARSKHRRYSTADASSNASRARLRACGEAGSRDAREERESGQQRARVSAGVRWKMYDFVKTRGVCLCGLASRSLVAASRSAAASGASGSQTPRRDASDAQQRAAGEETPACANWWEKHTEAHTLGCVISISLKTREETDDRTRIISARVSSFEQSFSLSLSLSSWIARVFRREKSSRTWSLSRFFFSQKPRLFRWGLS